MNRHYWITLIVGVFVLRSANAGIVDLSQYDLENKKMFNNFIFLPIIGSDRQGIFYYLDYEKRLTPPASFGPGWRSISIQMFPTADGTIEYNEFVAQNNIIDTRRNLFPQDAVLCALTHEIQTQLFDLGATFTTAVLNGGYPKACTIILRYFTEAESALEQNIIDLLSNQAGVTIAYSVELPDEPSVTVQLESIIELLVEAGVMNEIGYNQFNGERQAIVSYARNLSPGLYGSDPDAAISLDAWDLFTSAFEIIDESTWSITVDDGNRVLSNYEPQETIIQVKILR